MPESTPLGYPYPESEDAVRAHLDIQALAEAVDDSPGVSRLSQGALDNAGGDQIRNGRLVFNTTGKSLHVAVDSSWRRLSTQADVDAAAAEVAQAAADDLDTHVSGTQGVHGIADTSLLATKAYADSAAAAAAAGVVDAAPEALNTLNELAAALGGDASFATSVTNALAGKASLTDLADHDADTTNVHGIADTADIVLTSDSRLSDARTPTAHANSHATGSADPIAPSDIGAASAVHTHPYANEVHSHDYSPTGHSHDSFVPLSVVDAAGDLIVGSGSDTVGRLPAGPDGYIMKSVASGTGVNRIAWVDPFGNTETSANLSNALPQGLGTASAGIAVTASRSDHVHPDEGLGVAVGGSEPTTPGGYVWLDTAQEV